MTADITRRGEVEPATRERLLDAGATELRESGYAALTVRRTARRAGVSPATAYKVFASKQHLLAAVFLRHLRAVPMAEPDGTRPVEQRITAFVDGFVRTVLADPEFAAALRTTFFGDDPDSRRVRGMVVDDFERRFDAVCGDDLRGDARASARLLFAGAMLVAGSGLQPLDQVRDDLTVAVRRVRDGGRTEGDGVSR